MDCALFVLEQLTATIQRKTLRLWMTLWVILQTRRT